MLKQCVVEDLSAGMIIGHPVYENDSTLLLGEGMVLTNKMIFDLLSRPIYVVYIRVPDPPEIKKQQDGQKDAADKAGKKAKPAEVKTVPEIKNPLDESYVSIYAEVYNVLQRIFKRAARTNEINEDDVGNLLASGMLWKLSAKASSVGQIYNMDRNGEYLLHHSLNVAILAGVMGLWLHMPRAERQRLTITGLFHDIGKLKISDDILCKAGKLSTSERRVVQRHSQFGYELMKHGQFHDESEILLGILQHHERNDGSGYPLGLKNKEIGVYGRILAILDIYDAMAANRAYARRNSPFDVFKVLSNDIMYGKLDTEYGVLFIRQVCHSLNGSWVKLTNGEKAKIVYIDESRMSSLPVVQTEKGKFLDLNQEYSVKIKSLITSQELAE